MSGKGRGRGEFREAAGASFSQLQGQHQETGHSGQGDQRPYSGPLGLEQGPGPQFSGRGRSRLQSPGHGQSVDQFQLRQPGWQGLSPQAAFGRNSPDVESSPSGLSPEVSKGEQCKKCRFCGEEFEDEKACKAHVASPHAEFMNGIKTLFEMRIPEKTQTELPVDIVISDIPGLENAARDAVKQFYFLFAQNHFTKESLRAGIPPEEIQKQRSVVDMIINENLRVEDLTHEQLNIICDIESIVFCDVTGIDDYFVVNLLCDCLAESERRGPFIRCSF